MPTISTIKPAGGGDYTTLQAWWDAVKSQTTAQWAECYAGELGKLDLTGGAMTPTAAEYIRIYSPLSQRHTGQTGTGPKITASTGVGINVPAGFRHTEIDGITFAGSSAAVFLGTSNDTPTMTVKNCLIEYTGDAVPVAFDSSNNATEEVWTFVNNMVIVNTASTFQGMLVAACQRTTPGTCSVVVNVFNNTMLVRAGTVNRGLRLELSQTGGTAAMVANVRNNIVIGVTPDYYKAETGATITINASHNLSADATANDWGATGALESKAAADQFVNVASDWNLKAGADALAAGLDLANAGVPGALGTDYAGTDRGGSWDMGADQRSTSSNNQRLRTRRLTSGRVIGLSRVGADG